MNSTLAWKFLVFGQMTMSFVPPVQLSNKSVQIANVIRGLDYYYSFFTEWSSNIMLTAAIRLCYISVYLWQ